MSLVMSLVLDAVFPLRPKRLNQVDPPLASLGITFFGLLGVNYVAHFSKEYNIDNKILVTRLNHQPDKARGDFSAITLSVKLVKLGVKITLQH